MSVEEAQQAAFNVRMQNMALLLLTDPVQNLLAFGPGALLQKTMKKNKWFRLWRKKLPKNKWFQRGAWLGEFGLSSAFEGIEELSQDVMDANALGDEIDREALKWSFLVGSASGGIYHAGGSALKSFGARANKYVNDRILSARAEETQKQLDAAFVASLSLRAFSIASCIRSASVLDCSFCFL